MSELIETYKGIIYGPYCGTGDMFVKSIKFIESHHGTKKKSFYLRTGKHSLKLKKLEALHQSHIN